jgi:hypothetical protein
MQFKTLIMAATVLATCVVRAQAGDQADPLRPAQRQLTTQEAFENVLNSLKASHSLTEEEYRIVQTYVTRDGYDIVWEAFVRDLKGITQFRNLQKRSDDWKAEYEEIRNITRTTGGSDSEDLVCELAIRYVAVTSR